MTALENLDEQIKDIILQHGDIDIDNYPMLIRDAHELGINRNELSRKASRIFASLDLAPFRRIDTKLEQYILRGSIFNDEAEKIIEAASGELPRPRIINYIIATLRNRGFSTRENNAFEAESFRNLWMTDQGWKRYQEEKIEVEWLEEKARSLVELGRISYRKPVEAKHFLRNTNYIVPSITSLTKSASRAEAFSKIIENEPDIEKRYLKVIYGLDPTLPFRLNNQDFQNINALFEKTATDYDLFVAASESFNKRHLHIWLNQADPVNAAKLPGGWEFNHFLEFLYLVNNRHPFYLDSARYDNPDQLFHKAATDPFIWVRIADASDKGYLTTWFTSIGRNNLTSTYHTAKLTANGYNYYTEEEKKLAVVQQLIQAVDPLSPTPKIESSHKEVSLLSIEGNKPVHYPLTVNLLNTGFTKALFTLQNAPDGLSLSSNTYAFWGQINTVSTTIQLNIDASKLVRNRLYAAALFVDTPYERVTIPVNIKVVFPLKAYLSQLLKYAALFAVFFAAIRYLTGIITQSESWFMPQSTYLPQHYFSYFIGLVLFVAGLICAVFLIRKFEKI